MTGLDVSAPPVPRSEELTPEALAFVADLDARFHERRDELLADPAHAPVVLPRPRGWHFDEAHLTATGRPVVAALVDFGLHVFHNARELLAGGRELVERLVAEEHEALTLQAYDVLLARGD